MAYPNATLGSLPVKTLCNATDNDWLTSFQGLTSKAIRKHLPNSQQELEKELELDPPKDIIDREHYIGVTAVAFEKLKGIIATDLPGRFPTTSGLDK